MNYERLAGSPKYRDERVSRRADRYMDREEQRLADREERCSKRREVREARKAERIEQKLQAKRDRDAKKRFAARVENEDRQQRQASAAYYKRRKADELMRRAERRGGSELVHAAPRVLPPLPYGDAVPVTSLDRERHYARKEVAYQQWRRDNPEAAAAEDAMNAAHEAEIQRRIPGQ